MIIGQRVRYMSQATDEPRNGHKGEPRNGHKGTVVCWAVGYGGAAIAIVEFDDKTFAQCGLQNITRIGDAE